MRITRLITALALLVVIGASCGKDNTPGLDGNGLLGGKFSMKAGGTLQEATAAFVLTVKDEDSENYLVSINALFTPKGYSDDGEVTDAITLYMLFTDAQFNNPKGTYDVLALDSDPQGRPLVYALYQVEVGGDNPRHYSIPEANKAVGTFTITDFEIGNQTGIPGISGRGYTKLKGTFKMTLSELKWDGSGFNGELAITDGKFDVRNQFGF